MTTGGIDEEAKMTLPAASPARERHRLTWHTGRPVSDCDDRWVKDGWGAIDGDERWLKHETLGWVIRKLTKKARSTAACPAKTKPVKKDLVA